MVRTVERINWQNDTVAWSYFDPLRFNRLLKESQSSKSNAIKLTIKSNHFYTISNGNPFKKTQTFPENPIEMHEPHWNCSFKRHSYFDPFVLSLKVVTLKT